MKNKFIFIICFLFLFGCGQKKETLHVFYNPSCLECHLLEKDFIPYISDIVNVEMHNIDEKENVMLYKSCIEKLENIDFTLYEQCLTPFIYMEGGFGAIGYSKVMKEPYYQLIDHTINHEENSYIPSGVWLAKEE